MGPGLRRDDGELVLPSLSLLAKPAPRSL